MPKFWKPGWYTHLELMENTGAQAWLGVADRDESRATLLLLPIPVNLVYAACVRSFWWARNPVPGHHWEWQRGFAQGRRSILRLPDDVRQQVQSRVQLCTCDPPRLRREGTVDLFCPAGVDCKGRGAPS